VAGSFADQAGTPNANVLETESFTVAVPPAFSGLQIDFGTATSPVAAGYTGVTAADNYSAGVGYGWEAGSSLASRDRDPGSGDLLRDQVAVDFGSSSGTFLVDLANGEYEVTITLGDSNPKNGMGVILEGVQVATVSTAGGVYDTQTHTVTVSDGQLTLRLERQGSSYVTINALEIVAAGPPPPDTTAPTADLVSPANGVSIDPIELNAQGYIEVSFADVGDGVDAATIDGGELAISGTGVGTAVLSGTATLVSGTTYRYAFTGEFIEGTVSVDFVAGSFADLAGTPNLNVPVSYTHLRAHET